MARAMTASMARRPGRGVTVRAWIQSGVHPVAFDVMAEQTVTAVAPRQIRILSFAAICAGGLLGGLIGWAFVRLENPSNSDVVQALGALVGALACALGIAVVATLVLRAVNEWRTISDGVNPRTGEPLRARR